MCNSIRAFRKFLPLFDRVLVERFAAETAFRKFLPLFDRVLVERFAAETVTKGGIMLPEKSQGKVLQATVLAVGPGNRTKEYFLFRDGDILGKYLE
ncbi:UNVERIFIED_CONTAM: hypothetical protein FKN15_041808 [Acipenser sinensis]